MSIVTYVFLERKEKRI